MVEALSLASNLRVIIPNTGQWSDDEAGVIIEQDGTGKIYDAHEKLFREPSEVSDPFIRLKLDTGVFHERLIVKVPLSKSTFPDGDYLISFFDLAQPNQPRLFDVSHVSIFAGSSQTIRTPTAQENAARQMSAKFGEPHNKPGTFGWILMQYDERLRNLQLAVDRIESRLSS